MLPSRNRTGAVLLACLVVLGLTTHQANGQGQLSAVQGLLARMLPNQADKFVLAINPLEDEGNGDGRTKITGAVT